LTWSSRTLRPAVYDFAKATSDNQVRFTVMGTFHPLLIQTISAVIKAPLRSFSRETKAMADLWPIYALRADAC
jgi:hypothetical protein